MLATLALTFLVASKPAPAMTAEMAAKLTIGAQQYGTTPGAEVQKASQNSRALYLTPTDDIWVYAHAEDPQKDPFLRAWGSGGKSVGIPGDDPNAFSYSLLKWDLSGFQPNSRLAEAQIVLTAAPEAGYTAQDAAAAPLEIRMVKGGFAESEWDYADAVKYTPAGDEGLVGMTSPTIVTANEFKIVIDLLKGPADFRKAFEEAMKKGKTLNLAITSHIDPTSLGMKGVYRVYSKDATDPSVRPALRIVLENPPKRK
jgi:hypothetical protein